MIKKKQILVTGANGQLGLTFQDLEINYPDIEFTFLNSSQLNITSKQNIESVFVKNNFDFCINCAAYTNVEQAEKNPEIAFKINAEGVKNIAKACKTYNAKLIHISTDYVFDGKKKEPYTVHDIPNPINEYGKSKLLGEKYIQEILKDYFIVRTSWLYSKIHGKNFYKTILKKAVAREVLNITDEQVGCPTDTKNLGKYILTKVLFNDSSSRIHHFSDDNPMSWYEFAKKILIDNKLDKTTILVRADNYRSFAKRPKNSVLL